jgi:guanylate kinase
VIFLTALDVRDYRKKVICLIGESGSGKTTIVESLSKMGFDILQSYTTRKPRTENEWGHLFCSVEEYEAFKANGDIVAYSYFNNYHYFSTKEQMYKTDFYVVDFDGAVDLKNNINDIDFILVYLQVPTDIRIERMMQRGDSESFAISRVNHDSVKFSENKFFDYSINNTGEIDKTIDVLMAILDIEKDY